MDPWPWTLRQLHAAATEKTKLQWDHTAEIIAKMATIHCEGTYDASSFHPMRESVNIHLDDPAAEYWRLKKEEERRNGRPVTDDR